jgi:SAM-dependent methyltransferase
VDELLSGGAGRSEVIALVSESPRRFYDERYRAGYQQSILGSGYDVCVLEALRWAIAGTRLSGGPVLDFGCGQGRYLPVLAELVPAADLHGADISAVALGLAAERFPAARLVRIEDERVPFEGERFELIVMIDVIEHVLDAPAAFAELHRLLRPGGVVVLTTPCANRGSAAWAYNRLLAGFEDTPDGTGRFATDEPAHLRRLRSGDARKLLAGAGLELEALRFWGHVGTPLADRFERLPLGLRRRLAMLDWRLFRQLPNAGAMVLRAHKPSRERAERV